jgi:hypothetical protein
MPVSIGATQESSFANPIGLLTDGHRRIERFLEVLVRVATEAREGQLRVWPVPPCGSKSPRRIKTS